MQVIVSRLVRATRRSHAGTLSAAPWWLQHGLRVQEE